MRYKTIFYKVNENGRTLDEDHLLELDEKLPALEMDADISLPDADYFVVDKFYNLVFEKVEYDWVFTTCYGVVDQVTWHRLKNR